MARTEQPCPTAHLPRAIRRADLPAQVEAMCMKLLAKAPDQRCQTPEALLADLAEAAELLGVKEKQ